MKKIVVGALVTALAFAGSLAVAPTATAGSLEVLGASVTWDDAAFFVPDGCSRFKFNYVNGTGGRVLNFGFTLTSKYGDVLTQDSQIGIDNGIAGIWNEQICDVQLKDGLGPYTVTVSIKDYQGSVREATAPLTFLARPSVTTPTATPTPKKVRCINKTTFKKRTFNGRTKCPKGWVKI